MVLLALAVALVLGLLAGRPQEDASLEEGSIPGNRDGTPGRRVS